MPEPNQAAEVKLQEEFNRWAQEGKGEEMEDSHLPIVPPTLELMNLQPDDRVLDLGCGSGWLVRQLTGILSNGSVTGIDVSDEMIRHAQAATANLPNSQFLRGTAEELPAPANSFTKVISVESAYYRHDPARGLGEILRVLVPAGSAWVLVNYYRDNPDCHQWGAHYKTPAHLLSAAEWQGLFANAGFRNLQHRRIPDLSPTPEVYTGRWFRDAAQMRRFKAEGALLVVGVKP